MAHPQRLPTTRASHGGIDTRKLVMLAIVVAGVGGLYVSCIESHVQAGRFDDAIAAMGEPKLADDAEAASKPARRQGRVVIVTPRRLVMPMNKWLPPELHSAFHKLPRSLRAGSPDQVGTVVQVTQVAGQSDIWQRQDGLAAKVTNSRTQILTFISWPEKKVLGTVRLVPEQPSADVVDEAELEKIIEATSRKAIVAAIKAAPSL